MPLARAGRNPAPELGRAQPFVKLLLESDERQPLRQPDPKDPWPGLDRGTLQRSARGVDKDEAPFVVAEITRESCLGLVDAGIAFDIDVLDPVDRVLGRRRGDLEERQREAPAKSMETGRVIGCGQSVS